MCDHSPRRPLRTCVQRQEPLFPVRVPACAWGVFLAIDLSWCELVALPLRDTRSKTSQTIDARRMNSQGPLSPFGPDADRISNAFVLHKLRMDRN